MSDNKKYYYLKLKENFFYQDHIAYIESLTNGYIYSNILLKLYLKAIKYDGRLMITESIPYDPNNLEPLAKVIGHDPSHVCDAINLAVDFKLIKVIDMKEMYITDIQNFIGHSSTEADRIRAYRSKLKQLPDKIRTNVRKTYNKSTPELELELELDIDKEKNGNSHSVNKKEKEDKQRYKKIPPIKENVEKYIRQQNWNINADKFMSYYESNGWMVGRNKMKDWRAALKNWYYSPYNKNKPIEKPEKKRKIIPVVSKGWE